MNLSDEVLLQDDENREKTQAAHGSYEIDRSLLLKYVWTAEHIMFYDWFNFYNLFLQRYEVTQARNMHCHLLNQKQEEIVAKFC